MSHIIANDHYANGSCDLREAVSDALSFKRFLIEDCAFRSEDVTVLVNEAATRASVIGELKRLASETKPEDFVFIYRRGHGTFVRTKNKKKKVRKKALPFSTTSTPRQEGGSSLPAKCTS